MTMVSSWDIHWNGAMKFNSWSRAANHQFAEWSSICFRYTLRRFEWNFFLVTHLRWYPARIGNLILQKRWSQYNRTQSRTFIHLWSSVEKFTNRIQFAMIYYKIKKVKVCFSSSKLLHDFGSRSSKLGLQIGKTSNLTIIFCDFVSFSDIFIIFWQKCRFLIIMANFLLLYERKSTNH